MRVNHTCEMFVSLCAGEEQFIEVVNKDEGTGNNGEWEVALKDEIRCIS